MDSLSKSCPQMREHPVHELGHVELCDGFIEKARQVPSNVDMSRFSFGLPV